MNTIPDHPQLTAYVLGELSAVERTAFERELATQPALRQAVEELQQITQQINQAYAAEPKLELTPAQRRALMTYEDKHWWDAFLEATREGQRRWMWGGLTAATAVIAVAFVTVSQLKITEAPPQVDALEKSKDKAQESEIAVTLAPPASAPTTFEPSPIIVGAGEPGPAPAIVEETAPVVMAPPVAKTEVVTNDLLSADFNHQPTTTIPLPTISNPPIDTPSKSESTLEKNQAFAARAAAVREFTKAWGEGSASGNGSFASVGRVAGGPTLRFEPNTENYAPRADSNFLNVATSPLSTFSIDVDTAAYANVRRFLNQGQLPPKDAVRIEELINYFPYQDAAPKGHDPFAVKIEAMPAPWQPEHQLVRIGLKGREIELTQRPAMNLVFLIDVSGSMNEPNKLPLLQESLRLLVPQLREQDRVSMVVYAGNSGLVLPATSGAKKETILAAIDRLQAGGSTNGAAGIQLAYQVAVEQFQKRGVNRVILATDGDFNVGVSSDGELVTLIEEKAKTGVFLSVLSFGRGNLKDSKMEQLADKGNGNYAYIDTKEEARKVLVEQAGGTLITIAKDVKIQVEFNPAQVSSYRLIGYENRALADRDFNDDKKDAGEIGAGHSVTALYEVVPAGQTPKNTGVDALKYQVQELFQPRGSAELCTVKLRYKTPTGTKSELREVPFTLTRNEPSSEIKFAAAVAGFGMLLRDSEHKGKVSWDSVLSLAREGLGQDPEGYRAEFLTLAQKAKRLAAQG